MFRKLLPLLFVLPTVSQAQPATVDRKLLCNRTELVLAEIATSEFKENPIWIGDAEKDTKVAIITNEETKTWTVLIYNDKITCLVLAGQGYRLLIDNPKSKSK